MDLIRTNYRKKRKAKGSWSLQLLAALMLMVLNTNAFADSADPADPATWTVTPSSYAYDMTMTAVLYFDLNESTDPNDRIAAFNADDCRGVEYTRTVVEGRYLAYLRIYGNNSSGDTITLYIYDSSEDKVVEVVEKVAFVPQANYGTQSLPYEASVTFDVNFTVESDGAALPGAVVTLDGYGDEITDAAGEVVFANVPPTADMHYSVEKDDYVSVSGMVTVDDADVNELVDMELETYTLSIEVTDGIIPLGDMQVDIDGYGSYITNSIGKVHVSEVLPATGISISVTGAHFHQKNASVDVVDADVFRKITVNPVTYSLQFNVTDHTGGVEETEVSLTTNSVKAEDFADGLIQSPFHTSGSGAWQLYQDTTVVSDYAIRSAGIGDNQSSVLTLTDNFGDGKISFYAKISSEAANDRLVFSIDGITKGSWSGDMPWQLYEFPVTGGSHTLQWSYVKDGSSVDGEDCAWLDYIAYTSADSVVETAETNAAGEAMISSIHPGRKIYLSARSDDHEYYFGDLNQLTSDSVFVISLAPVYDVHFTVKSNNHLSVYDVKNANIYLPDLDSSKLTNEDGYAGFSRISVGKIPFTISADKHQTYIDTLEVTEADVDTTIEIVLLDYETYALEFEVIDGDVPVSGVSVSLEGYGELTTNVYGKALFTDVLSKVDMGYEVSGVDYYTQTGTIEGLVENSYKKIVLNDKTYNMTVRAADADGPVQDMELNCTVNGEDRVEDFFSDVLPSAFETYGNGDWTVNADTMLQGEYAVRSAQIFDNQESVLKLEQYMRDGYVSFYVKVSSEESNDVLLFEMNGEEIARWSGEVPWQYYRMKVPAGTHTFEWKYIKDGNYSAGADAAWVDYIKTPSADSVVQETVTDENGEAVLYNIRPHNLVLFEGYSMLHEEYTDSVKEIRSDTVLDIALTRVYDLEFNVYSDEASGSIPVRNAIIEIVPGRNETTDYSGYATFDRISIGTQVYAISAEGYYDLIDSVEVVDGLVTVDAVLELIPQFKAANVITPNGDGYNDYWEIYNIGNYASFTVSIYSAIGELLYTTTDYENNKWNGKSGDRKLPDGVYYYIITSPHDDMVFEGVINLINK